MWVRSRTRNPANGFAMSTPSCQPGTLHTTTTLQNVCHKYPAEQTKKKPWYIRNLQAISPSATAAIREDLRGVFQSECSPFTLKYTAKAPAPDQASRDPSN